MFSPSAPITWNPRRKINETVKRHKTPAPAARFVGKFIMNYLVARHADPRDRRKPIPLPFTGTEWAKNPFRVEKPMEMDQSDPSRIGSVPTTAGIQRKKCGAVVRLFRLFFDQHRVAEFVRAI